MSMGLLRRQHDVEQTHRLLAARNAHQPIRHLI